MTVAPALLSSRTTIISSRNRHRGPGDVVVLDQQAQGDPSLFLASSRRSNKSKKVVFLDHSTNKVPTSYRVVFKQKEKDQDVTAVQSNPSCTDSCDETTTTFVSSCSALSFSEDGLQSVDKRRRYMRRGSKTSLMMRGTCCAFLMELQEQPQQNPKWRQKASSSLTTRKTTSASNPMLLSSMHDNQMSSALHSPAASCYDESKQEYDLCSSTSTTSSPTMAKNIHEREISSARLGTIMELGHETRKDLPLFNPPINTMTNKRLQTTVSLVTLALELSYIEDQHPYMEL